MSLNLNGRISKLESSTCQSFLQNYDIIGLCEIKTAYAFSMTGYDAIRSSVVQGEELRGGVSVLIRSNLSPSVYGVRSSKDQVWFKLHCVPGIYFCVCYITPHDSPYFDYSSFATMQAECMMTNDCVLIMGDLNARMPSLSKFNCHKVYYRNNLDTSANAHGREIENICLTNGIIPLNHLHTDHIDCIGDFTYRQKDEWISQIDWILCSKDLIPSVTDFHVLKDHPIPTNHAAVACDLNMKHYPIKDITDRARLLGSYDQGTHERNMRKPVKFVDIDVHKFLNDLADINQLLYADMTVDCVSSQLSELLYDSCKAAVQDDDAAVAQAPPVTCDRWYTLLHKGNDRDLWKAINWKGEITYSRENDIPSDTEFAEHFRKLLNPNDLVEEIVVPRSNVYIPLLDDDISPIEVDRQIKRLKVNKAAGADGIPPGIIKYLPDNWIVFFTYLCNKVFSGHYPSEWKVAKLVALFKKGSTADTNNYRGISILNALAKIYDGVLNYRFVQWFTPDEEQAGGQSGRGCQEQIVIIRLLIDYARRTKQPLYLMFVDYQKAYDRVNRNKLLAMLADAGCGDKFLSAISETLRETLNVLGTQIIVSKEGIRQGGNTSCSLFTFYINETIRAVKQYGYDGYLQDLHSLLLMDDTVLLATNRDAMQEKFQLLVDAAVSLDMVVHPGKSKFLIVNGDDNQPFMYKGVTVEKTSSYTYLGTPILISSVSQQIFAHLAEKQKHVRKFSSFLSRNNDAPFLVKYKTWSAAMTSALIYSCESWLTSDLRSLEQPMLRTLKELLGVRAQTCSDLVYLELGQPSAKAMVLDRQQKFFAQLTNRPNYDSSIVKKVIDLVIRVKSPMGRNLLELLRSRTSYVTAELMSRVASVQSSDSSRRKDYLHVNPNLTRHTAYDSPGIPEYVRIAFTRLRLSSHRLRMEVGRWSRIPRDLRLCQCGSVQTMEHILLVCPIAADLRATFPMLCFLSVEELMSTQSSKDLCTFSFKLLDLLTV